MGALIVKSILYIKRKNLVPQRLQMVMQKRMNVLDLRTASWVCKNPYANDPPISSYEPKSPFVLGIMKEFWHMHWPYIAACRDLGVAYKVLDISGPAWQDVVEKSGCDAFLVWPSVQFSSWKQMYDERLKIIVEEMGKIIYPTYKELWFYESKRRVHYWLEANDAPHPKTWVFYDREKALDFVEKAELPLVYKSNLGSGASGVVIFRQRTPLRKHVKNCFKRGFTTCRRGPSDKEWGSLFLQEYIPGVAEWRVIRIGSSYFAYQKGRAGDFHSGSHIVVFADPPRRLLGLARELTNKADFTSMSLDIFETPDGRYLVNELHPVFGRDPWDHSMEVDGKPGRYVMDERTKQWRFEEGTFTENSCCNLRVKTLIQILETDRFR